MGQPILEQETRSELRKQNEANFNTIINGRSMREPRRLIYIHTVSKKPRIVNRTLFPHLLLKGCDSGERYVTCAVIADPIAQPSPDQERGGIRVDEHDGWRAIIDLLNPRNTTNDPYSGDTEFEWHANKSGQNLLAEGFFPSTREVPTEKEIIKAEECVKKHFKWLTDQAIRMAGSGMQKEFNEFLQTYPDVHPAMDALGLSAPWHAASVIEAFCPNCGEKIRPGVAFHKSDLGPCVIDPARAFKAGVIDREKMEELLGIDQPAPVKQAPRRG